jgi:D-alanyl-D-alanine carboxypeptidase
MTTFSSPTARDLGLQRGLRNASEADKESAARFLISDVSGKTLLEQGPINQPMVLSGITKLYTLAMVLREFDRGALSPDTRASHILPHNTLAGLCMIGRRDYSEDITISHLLSHRSGISDYFAFPKRGALSLVRQIGERDRSWSFEQALELARHYPGRFKPGTPGRVHYSDTNYQILGAILKTTTGLSFAQLLDIRIVGPLRLKQTYAFTSERREKYYELAPVTWKDQPMHVPQSLASLGADGSVVSTTKELVTFLGALWAGKLCDESWIPRVWSDTTPLAPKVGMGLGVMTHSPRRNQVPLIGHSGFTGSVALIDPTRRLFGAGSLNQVQWMHKPLGTLAKKFDKLSL